jgi:two-component sensor histidine kinase
MYEDAPATQTIFLDITVRKQAEQQIRASLQEKEILLKEIHHRVKNNLQVISSLLDLQADYVEDPQLLQVFQDSQHRVRSMALVHEKLYQSQNLADIKTEDYVQNLVQYLFSAYNNRPNTIRLIINVDNITLDIYKAVPCGLIISELVSNTLKYAFPETSVQSFHNAELQIQLRVRSDEQLILTVSDNGVGLPSDLDWQNASSLGLRLVWMLTQQLQGVLEVNTDSGTTFKVTFARF